MNMHTLTISRAIVLAALVIAFGIMPCPPAWSQPADNPDVKSDDGHLVRISVGRSQVINAPWPVKQVSVADPKTADVQVITPGQVVLLGKSIGTTDVVLWSEDDHVWHARVDVGADQSRMLTDLKSILPGAKLQLTQAEDVLVVGGLLARADQAQRLQQYLKASGVKYVDTTSLAGVQQVQIKVRVAEVSRSAARALGIDSLHVGDDFFGSVGVGGAPANIGVPDAALASDNLPFTFNSDTSISSAVTLLAGFPAADLELFIRAMADNQYLRFLAEPNLVALNGQEASFLAGGEFPIPVVQGAGASTSGSSISIEYKEFGVQLYFRPTVLGDNKIRLEVAAEVSDITFVDAIEIQGFNMPTILSRRVSTTLELHSGQTFGMAGLLQRTTDSLNSRVPGLGRLPVLGPLFRSVRYESGETELVVLVTAALVEPMSLASTPPVPGELHLRPSDWELYLEGRIEGEVPSRIAPVDADWMSKLGLDQLSGPGAWAAHDQPIARDHPALRPSVSGTGDNEQAAPPSNEAQ